MPRRDTRGDIGIAMERRVPVARRCQSLPRPNSVPDSSKPLPSTRT